MDAIADKRERHQLAEKVRRAQISEAFAELSRSCAEAHDRLPKRAEILRSAYDAIKTRQERIQALRQHLAANGAVASFRQVKSPEPCPIIAASSSQNSLVGAKAVISLSGNVIECNDSFERQTGLVANDNFFGIFDEDVLAMVYARLSYLNSGGKLYSSMQVTYKGRQDVAMKATMLLGACRPEPRTSSDGEAHVSRFVCILQSEALSKFWCPCSERFGDCPHDIFADAGSIT